MPGHKRKMKVRFPYTGYKRRVTPKYWGKRVRYRIPRAGIGYLRTGGFLGLENKFFDVEHSSSAFSTTWVAEEPATTNLTAMIQGDGESERIGRKYTINSIHIRGAITTSALESQAAPITDILCRLVLVWDQQTNGAQLTATQVMDAGPAEDIHSFRNLQFTQRFKVLWDKTFLVKRNNTNEGAVNLFAAAGTRSHQFVFNKYFQGGINVTMSGTTADIANVVDNSLHMIGIATDTAAIVSYVSRIRFKG